MELAADAAAEAIFKFFCSSSYRSPPNHLKQTNILIVRIRLGYILEHAQRAINENLPLEQNWE